MLHTIFKFEFIQISRSKGICLALLVFTGIGLFALQQGKSIYNFQKTAIQKNQDYVLKNQKSVASVLDTLNTNIPRSDRDYGAPYFLEWKLQAAEVKNITPLSILCIGQNDIYTPIISTNFSRPFLKNEFTEFQNPEQLLVGNLDSSFFILFLFPLLFMALSYNLKSDDKETGVFTLLKSQSISIQKIVYYRLIFRWLVALLPVLVLIFASYSALLQLPNFSFQDFMTWWFVTLLYALFWLFLVAIVLHFDFNSLINVITLAGIWVALLIAIPSFLNTWFNYKYPSMDKTAIAEHRDIDFKGYDKSFAAHQKIVFSKYPKWKETIIIKDSSYFKSFGNSLESIEKEKEIYNLILKKTKLQTTAETNSFWINPVGGVMRAFTTLSESNLQNQQEFELASIDLREQKLHYLYVNYLTKPHFTKTDFQNLPQFKMPAKKSNWMDYLFPLFAFQILIIVFLIFYIKYDINNIFNTNHTVSN